MRSCETTYDQKALHYWKQLGSRLRFIDGWKDHRKVHINLPAAKIKVASFIGCSWDCHLLSRQFRAKSRCFFFPPKMDVGCFEPSRSANNVLTTCLKIALVNHSSTNNNTTAERELYIMLIIYFLCYVELFLVLFQTAWKWKVLSVQQCMGTWLNSEKV